MTFDDLKKRIDECIESGAIKGSDSVGLRSPYGISLLSGLDAPTLLVEEGYLARRPVTSLSISALRSNELTALEKEKK